MPDHQGGSEGHGEGYGKSGKQSPLRMVRVCGSESGDGGLDGPGTEGEEDPVYWKDHLIDSKSLRSDGAGEEDPVEKAQDAGEESCGCEENGSGDEWVRFMGRRHGGSVEAEGFCYIYAKPGDGYDG